MNVLNSILSINLKGLLNFIRISRFYKNRVFKILENFLLKILNFTEFIRKIQEN